MHNLHMYQLTVSYNLMITIETERTADIGVKNDVHTQSNARAQRVWDSVEIIILIMDMYRAPLRRARGAYNTN